MDLWIHVSLILALSRLLLEQSLSASFWVSIHSSIGVNWRNCTYEIVSLSQCCTIYQSLVKSKKVYLFWNNPVQSEKTMFANLRMLSSCCHLVFFYIKGSVNNLWNTLKIFLWCHNYLLDLIGLVFCFQNCSDHSQFGVVRH